LSRSLARYQHPLFKRSLRRLARDEQDVTKGVRHPTTNPASAVQRGAVRSFLTDGSSGTD